MTADEGHIRPARRVTLAQTARNREGRRRSQQGAALHGHGAGRPAVPGPGYTAAGSVSSAPVSSPAVRDRSRVSRRTSTTQPTGTAAANSHHWTAYA